MNIKISAKQYFKLIVIYIIANDITRGFYASDLKSDIWIPIIVGIIISILLFTFYMFLYKNSKFNDFDNSIKNVTGKYFSKLIYFLYIFYFIVITFFNLVDIIESIRRTLLMNTSYISIALVILIAIGYFLFKGFEVVARLSEVLFILLMLIFLSMVVFSFALYEIKFINLLPILYDGYKKVVGPALEMGYSVPFGELFVMIMFFQYIDKKEEHTKTGNISILFAGFILITVTVLNMLIIGPYTLEYGIHPALRLARYIDIEEYVQRVDLLIVGIHLIWILIKAFVLLYAAGEMLRYIFNFKEKMVKISYVVLVFIVFLLIIFLSKEYMRILRFRRDYFNDYAGLIMEVLIPLILVSLSFIRKSKIKFNPDEIVSYDI